MDMRLKFNEIPETYDRLRPTYLTALYEDIFAYTKLKTAANVLEIGVGTGQATRPMLERGFTVTAVELGDRLAAFVKQKYADYPNFEVINVGFEQFSGAEHAFDLIYSASAFHWIPEQTGYPKVFRHLKRGGVFARFANHPYQEEDALRACVQEVYDVYMPGSNQRDKYNGEQCRKVAEIPLKYGFTDIAYHLYRRERQLSARDYADIISTFHDHRALGAKKLSAMQRDIENVIEKFGGTITIHDTQSLQLARKP